MRLMSSSPAVLRRWLLDEGVDLLTPWTPWGRPMTATSATAGWLKCGMPHRLDDPADQAEATT